MEITGGCSSMVEQQPSKLNTRVRFPSPAPMRSQHFVVGYFLSAQPSLGGVFLVFA